MVCRVLLCIILVLTVFPASAASPEESYGKKSTFHFIGNLGDGYGDSFKFAVTGWLGNKSETITLDETGKFEADIDICGPLQEAYLYLPKGLVTVPVVPDDTIMIDMSGGNLELSSKAPLRDRDLKMAMEVSKKMRNRFLSINLAYYKANSDSAQIALADSINAYIKDNLKIIEEFEAGKGPLGNKDYFIHDAYFTALRFAVGKPTVMKRIAASVACADGTVLDYRSPTAEKMIYPSMREFTGGLITSGASSAVKILGNTKNPDLTEMKIGRLMSPDSFVADFVNADQLSVAMMVGSDEDLVKGGNEILAQFKTSWLADELRERLERYGLTATGCPLPKLVLKDEKGKPVDVGDYKGKLVLLDFWSVGCGPCMAEFKKMPEFKKEFSDVLDNVKIITVCCGNPDKKSWQEIIKRFGLDEMNTLLVADESDLVYSEMGWPTYVLVGKDGRILKWNVDRPSTMLIYRRMGAKTPIDDAGRD